jgi:hypothetical protein
MVGGQAATLLTATTDRALDGSLGCPTRKTSAPDCFGLQPDLALRIAVVKVHDQTLLIWLREDEGADTAEIKERIEAFEEMLATLRFSDRSPVRASPSGESASTAPAPSAIDGDYRMSVSWPKVKTADGRCVGGPEGTSRRAVYDLSLDRGELQLSVRIGGVSAPSEPADAGSFRTIGTQFEFTDAGMSAAYSFDGQRLTLTDLQGGECGDRAIWTTKPWVRQ